jgi:hypothetical protein
MKEPELNQGALEVRVPEAAALLVHPKAVVALAPFLGHERTLSEAAAQAGLKLPTLSYWVQRLLAAGLLQQTHTEARAGSPIRFYRSVAPTFYVPYAVLPPEVVETFRRRNSAELERRLDEALAEVYGPWGEGWGLRVARHPSGKAAVNQVSGPGSQTDPGAFAALSLWDGLSLTPEDAQQLQRDLYALLEQYRGRGGVQTYLVRIAVAPLAE